MSKKFDPSDAQKVDFALRGAIYPCLIAGGVEAWSGNSVGTWVWIIVALTLFASSVFVGKMGEIFDE